MRNDLNVLLSGIVGSTAYGLAGPDSDVDRLGIYAAPTAAFHGLTEPQETYADKAPDPDYTMHEARKYARLALQGNPTVMELMWLPVKLLEYHTNLGGELRDIRSSFLSAKRVRAAYLGYASQQFRRLQKREDGSFSSDTRKRTSKHARHMARLLIQGSMLYRTGELLIELENPQWYHNFGDSVANGDIERAEILLATIEAEFDQWESKTPLPENPDTATVEDWLQRVRKEFYS